MGLTPLHLAVISNQVEVAKVRYFFRGSYHTKTAFTKLSRPGILLPAIPKYIKGMIGDPLIRPMHNSDSEQADHS